MQTMFLTIRRNRLCSRAAALVVVLLLIPTMAAAQERQITDIKVIGNERISTEAILAAIELKPGMAFTEQAVQKAKQAIESMGYFEAGVTTGIESVDSGVTVVFNVIENPVVKEIKITGNTVVDTEKLLSLMRTSVGSVLNTNTLLQQDTRAIENYYSDLGYSVYVTEEIGIDPETGVLTVPIMEIRIEEIRITGNRKTKTYVILREMEQKPGDVYNRKILFSDLQRIYDLGIFEREAIEPYKLEAGSELGKAIITIPLKESKTGEISIGLGYSSRQRLIGQARLSESNFRGRAQSVSLSWEQSGARGSSFEAGFFEPWLDKKHTSLSVNIYNKLIFRFASDILGGAVNTDDDYDERRQGGSVTLSRPFTRNSRGYVTLRSESVDTNVESISSVLAADGNVSSGTLRFTHDVRDSALDPFAGTYNSYAVEVGRADFANQADSDDTTFAKYSIDLRRYFSKGGPRKELDEQRPRLAVRLMAGSLSGNVPFFEQYFLGGAETLRGFREDRFWGRRMFLASAEYRFPLASSLTGVAFVDYGDAWGASPQFRLPASTPTDPLNTLLEDMPQHEGFSPNLGYGVGIRVQTPIGPLRLDYGLSEEGSRAHFSIGHVF